MSNQLNHGTRSKEHPEGGPDPLPRELRGNQQASKVAILCYLLDKRGGIFAVVNAFDSLIFHCASFRELCVQRTNWESVFDQCAYGLQLPGSASHVFCKKRTAILANFSSISVLNRTCCGVQPTTHEHEHAWGSRSVGGVSVKLATAAGAYPQLLAREIGRVMFEECKRRFSPK